MIPGISGQAREEAEALIEEAREWDANPDSWGDNGLVGRLADALAASLNPEPSEGEVLAALNAFIEGDFWADYPDSFKYWEPKMRAALTAARTAREAGEK